VSRTPELSVVAPLHNEEATVAALFASICAALEPLGRPFEVLLVNDGSTDGTAALLDGLAAADARLRPVHLDGNFGEAAALSAGFGLAAGGIVLTLDGDLQNDPADLPRLLELLEGGSYRAVSGWRRRRQEAFGPRVLPSRIANWLIARVTGLPSRDNGCGLKAYRAEVVRGVCLPDGLHRFMPAVFGVRQGEFAQVEVTDRRRQAGRSHYGLSRFFAVVRDLLAIPYLLRGPRQGLVGMQCVGALSVALALASLEPLEWGGKALGIALGLLAGLLLAYALLVRRNLARWLRAQARPTYQLRSGPAGATA
jgi:glycosyltransferase involved in cell wall biosynthesis